jgi:hypothetical protein
MCYRVFLLLPSLAGPYALDCHYPIETHKIANFLEATLKVKINFNNKFYLRHYNKITISTHEKY